MIVLNDTCSEFGRVLVVALVLDGFAFETPLFAVFAAEDEGIVDEFLGVEATDLLGFERAVGGEVLEGAGEEINFDAEIVDWVRREVLLTRS